MKPYFGAYSGPNIELYVGILDGGRNTETPLVAVYMLGDGTKIILHSGVKVT